MTQSGNVCIVIPSNSAVSPRAIVIPRLSAHVPLSALATLGPTMDTWADNLGLTMALGLTITVGRADNTPRCPPCSYYWYITMPLYHCLGLHWNVYILTMSFKLSMLKVILLVDNLGQDIISALDLGQHWPYSGTVTKSSVVLTGPTFDLDLWQWGRRYGFGAQQDALDSSAINTALFSFK